MTFKQLKLSQRKKLSQSKQQRMTSVNNNRLDVDDWLNICLKCRLLLLVFGWDFVKQTSEKLSKKSVKKDSTAFTILTVINRKQISVCSVFAGGRSLTALCVNTQAEFTVVTLENHFLLQHWSKIRRKVSVIRFVQSPELTDLSRNVSVPLQVDLIWINTQRGGLSRITGFLYQLTWTD